MWRTLSSQCKLLRNTAAGFLGLADLLIWCRCRSSDRKCRSEGDGHWFSMQQYPSSCKSSFGFQAALLWVVFYIWISQHFNDGSGRSFQITTFIYYPQTSMYSEMNIQGVCHNYLALVLIACPMAIIYVDQHDPSSAKGLWPDATIIMRNALTLKIEMKPFDHGAHHRGGRTNQETVQQSVSIISKKWAMLCRYCLGWL